MLQIIKTFLSDESGGIGSTIGKVVGTVVGGPIGGAVAGAFGQSYDDRKAFGKAAAWERRKYVREVEAARLAGIHPLEVIRAGGGNSGGSARLPTLGTSAALQGQFDQIDSILTGEDAKQRKRDELNDELLRIEVDERRRGVLPKQSTQRGRVGSFAKNNSSERTVGLQNQIADTEDRQPGVTNPYRVTGSDDDWFANPARKDMEDYTARHGESEIAETLMFPISMIDDFEYNRGLTAMAKEYGISRKAMHERVIKDPSIRAKLPNFIERAVMSARELAGGKAAKQAELQQKMKMGVIERSPFNRVPRSTGLDRAQYRK